MDGVQEGTWILADYLDVVLHVFTPERAALQARGPLVGRALDRGRRHRLTCPVFSLSLSKMTTNQKGAIAETAIAHAGDQAWRRGVSPVAGGGRYDLIFVLTKCSFGSVQVGCAAGNRARCPCASSWRNGDRFIHRPYTAADRWHRRLLSGPRSLLLRTNRTG